MRIRRSVILSDLNIIWQFSHSILHSTDLTPILSSVGTCRSRRLHDEIVRPLASCLRRSFSSYAPWVSTVPLTAAWFSAPGLIRHSDVCFEALLLPNHAVRQPLQARAQMPEQVTMTILAYETAGNTLRDSISHDVMHITVMHE